MNKLKLLNRIKYRRMYKLRSLVQERTKREIEKRKSSAQKDYEKEVSEAYIEHNKKANERAYKKVLSSIEKNAINLLGWKLAFEKAYNETPISKKLKNTLAERTEAYYKDHKANYELNIIDERTVNTLSKSDLLWIQNHATRTLVSSEMNRIISNGIMNQLSADAIAENLMNHFKDMAPEAYVKIFGEQSYWEMVTNTNVTRIRSFNDLNTYVESGITQYKINTRGSLACQICAPYEGNVYDIGPAITKKDLYLKYADESDVESMKGVYTFGEANVDGLGETPPFHPNCYCILEPILEEV